MYFRANRIDAEKLPPIQANFVDLNYIKEISLYRSCEGHIKVPYDKKEPPSSMNHYFFVKDSYWEQKTPIPLYSPYDGFIYSGDGNNLYITIQKVDNSKTLDNQWFFEIYHAKLLNNIKSGQAVHAGDLVAFRDSSYGGNGFDIIIARKFLIPRNIYNFRTPYKEMDSLFNYLPDDIFTLYQTKGIESRESMILTREDRYNNPCQIDPNDAEKIYFPKDNSKKGVLVLKD
jgi:hypothetical protein